MSNLFDINLVCLDGGDHFMEKDPTAKDVDDDAGTAQEAPPVDFIRTPVSASDQLDIHMMAGGVVDFDLDDEEEDEEEDEGISDNDDSDDTAPAVEETPKRDFTYCKSSEHEDPWTWPPQLEDIGPTLRATIENVPKTSDRGPSVIPMPFKKPWHMQIFDSLIGTNSCSSPTSYPGGAMTYEEAMRPSANRRPRRISALANAA